MTQLTEFAIPTANSAPFGITSGPDGALWFAEAATNKIGRISTTGSITEFDVSGNPGGIARGPDGALWFTEISGNAIGRITATGTVSTFAIPTVSAVPHRIVAGPDGALWFTEVGTDKIGRIATDGTITEFAVPTANAAPFDITAGPDGALWFTEFSSNQIGRLTTSGSFTEFSASTSGADPAFITRGPDGALWFTDASVNQISRITTTGVVTTFAVPIAVQDQGITTGPDGAIWFAERFGSDDIGRITTGGTITEFAAPTAGSQAIDITTGPDGNLWFTEFSAGQIGELILGPAAVIEASGATSLVQQGSNYFLDPVGTSSGLELKFNGAPVTAGQFGIFTPIGAERTASGYDVAWEIPGANEFLIWGTDNAGNQTSYLTGIVSGSSAALQSFEPIFHQDLNSDGSIGIVIEAAGATSLVQQGNNYFLDAVGTSSGPELKFNGAPVTAGQFGGFTPIGAEQTASGYDIAWSVPGANAFLIWGTDPNGNQISYLTGVVPGSSQAIKSFEPIFHQDLNGDGSVDTAIEAAGATSLVQQGNNYFLDGVSGSAGPELKFDGAPVTAGQFGGFTPIGAEQTASGYDVAWSVPGANAFLISGTDNAGNQISYPTGVVPGSDPILQSFEPIFHQDLNGDGSIGIVIEAAGATSLVQQGSNYFLDAVGTSSGPELKFSGAPVAAGQFGAFTAIGAEQTASGYDVAWSVPGANAFLIWGTDNAGNQTSYLTGVVSGGSSTLQSFETIFHQDLNGNGTIGT